MSPNSPVPSERQSQPALERARLRQILEARAMTQRQLAGELHLAQSDISQLGQRADLYINTLASFLTGMGVDLRIEAVFPDGKAIRIERFEDAAA